MSLKLMEKGDRLGCAQAAEDTELSLVAELLRDFKRVRAYDDGKNGTLFVSRDTAFMAVYGGSMYGNLPGLVTWYHGVKKTGRRW